MLRISLSNGVEFFAFADDVALVVIAKKTYILEEMLTTAAEKVDSWLTKLDLS